MKEWIKDKEWMPYNEWKKKVPSFAQWLENNGFRYDEKYDKGKRELGDEK
jgi:hypothetical protein